ncbi:LIC_13387 family protein [Undibacterium fentianense]|uniref:Uncharacterized protein n=1 Tax=Undibacterium fentianense TaxID=2828728 RepID=A0A941E3R2_9BURK|nr:hypothetical protein [Undibacterium fentianense]MBR7801755.1 hypothetical protein [Undibacterium fentianense]
MSGLGSILIGMSALIFLVLGSIHLYLSFFSRVFYPRDDHLLDLMQSNSPRLTRQTTLWRAGLGFHASHSLGAMLYGALFLYFVTIVPDFFFKQDFLLVIGFIYVACMFALARRYWFRVPFYGTALASILYLVGGVVARFSP